MGSLSVIAIFLGCFNTVSVKDVFAAEAAESARQVIAERYDKNLLKSAHEPSIEEEFEADEVRLILNKEFSAEKSDSKLKSLVSKLGDFKIGKAEKLIEKQDLSIEDETTFRQIISLKLNNPNKQLVLKLVERLKNTDGVLFAQPNYIYHAEDEWVPSDPDYGLQWGLNDSNGINATATWDITRGGF